MNRKSVNPFGLTDFERVKKPAGAAAPKAPLCKGSWIFSP